MSLLMLFVIAMCIVALLCGASHAVGTVVIALLKYVVAPVALLIAVLAVIKYAF